MSNDNTCKVVFNPTSTFLTPTGIVNKGGEFVSDFLEESTAKGLAAELSLETGLNYQVVYFD